MRPLTAHSDYKFEINPHISFPASVRENKGGGGLLITMRIQIPDYHLKRILRAYEALAQAYRPDGSDNRAANARRIARKEIAKAFKLIDEQSKANGTDR